MSLADELLHAYLNAPDEDSAEALSTLISVLQPVCRRVVRARLWSHRDYIDDVTQDVVVRLIARLQNLRAMTRAGKAHSQIQDVTAWAIWTASGVCSDYLRKANPLRTHLANALRYRFGRSLAFRMWTGGDRRFVCGWRKCQGIRPLTDPAFERVWALPRVVKELATVQPEYSPALWRGLATLFACADGPIYFKVLISALMGNSVSVDRRPAPIADPLSTDDVERNVMQKELLEKLWLAAQIILPDHERLSLLLGLPLATLWELAVITQTEAVAALGLPLETLKQSPLSDDKIADILKLDERDPIKRRQYVANRRRDAKRRLRDYFGGL